MYEHTYAHMHACMYACMQVYMRVVYMCIIMYLATARFRINTNSEVNTRQVNHVLVVLNVRKVDM